jgi:hypothetical protein
MVVFGLWGLGLNIKLNFQHGYLTNIAFALVVQQAFAVTLSIVSKSLKPNTEHKRPRGESDGDRTMPSTNHS